MMAKPMKTLELHYPMIQFLIIYFIALSSIIYKNQINARALIGQSAMVYGASKLREKIARLLNYYIKAKDHTFLWFRGMINHLGLSAYKP